MPFPTITKSEMTQSRPDEGFTVELGNITKVAAIWSPAAGASLPVIGARFAESQQPRRSFFWRGLRGYPNTNANPSPGFIIMIAPRTINPEHEPTEDQRDAVVHNGFTASYRGSRSPRNDANDIAGEAVPVETVRLRGWPDGQRQATPSFAPHIARDHIVSLANLVVAPAIQPIVEINTGHVYGYEALMRGFDRLGLASPTELLDHAAQSGSLVRLETMLFKRAIAKFASIPKRQRKKLFLNLDGRALNATDELFAAMAQSVQAHGLALSDLCIELSERYNNGAAPGFSQIAMQLRGLGVRMAIDDFGTGFSELKMLCDHSVDYVKIDRHFIRGIAENQRKRLLVTTITKLAHGLGVRVVAEGVETESDLFGCREAGCDLVQGYFVGRPTTDVTELPVAYGKISIAIDKHDGNESRLGGFDAASVEHAGGVGALLGDGQLM
jgi:EAL domain-containing protein (putative c-di-GMP-specific phosphodiesterase class I)